MKKTYVFFGSGDIEFDDSRSVKELIEYAFDQFDYYEPMGMDIVTVFQCHHPKTNVGWFTTDVNRSCAEEIVNPRELCFAYYLPGVFYFAEGGWGHHMINLGNHPEIPNPVSIHLRLEDFDENVVINGNYTFYDVVIALKNADYVSMDCQYIKVLPVGVRGAYSISLSDPIMRVPLTDFKKMIPQYNKRYISGESFIYHEIFEIR